MEMQIDGVETDVHLTKDGKVVLCHNTDIDATSDGQGEIAQMTLAELKRFDFGCRFPGFAGKGVTVPTLREVYELIAPTGLLVDCELKTNVYAYPGIEQKCLDLAEEFGMRDRIVYSSFNFDSLQRLLAIDPEVRTALLYEDPLEDALATALQQP